MKTYTAYPTAAPATTTIATIIAIWEEAERAAHPLLSLEEPLFENTSNDPTARMSADEEPTLTEKFPITYYDVRNITNRPSTVKYKLNYA